MADTIPEMVAAARSLGVYEGAYRGLSGLLEGDGRRATASRITAAVRIDPTLTAGLLARAQVRGADPITTVSRASLTVGRSALRELLLGHRVAHMFRGVPEHLLDLRSYWDHSVAVGLLCHHLAVRRGAGDTEEAYVAGLLHDFGTLVLGTVRPRLARRVLAATENAERPGDLVEAEQLGFTHAELGAAVLEDWGLPAVHVCAARLHHTPDQAPPAHRATVELVHVADVAVSALQLGNAGERAANRLAPGTWERLGVSLDDLEGALDQLEGDLDDLHAAVAS